MILTDEETQLRRNVNAQKNMALLERGEISNVEFVNRQGRAQNKTQLKKVYDWGNEQCAIHSPTRKGFLRRHCDKCWQGLLEDVKDATE